MSNLSRGESRAALTQVIRDCVYHALGLKETLTDERKALEVQDTEALQSSVAGKKRFIGELEMLETKRQEISVASGFGPGPEEMHEVARWCDEDLEIENRWQHFLQIARQCSDMNQTNGTIIHLRRRHTMSALSCLSRGSSDSETYGPGGREVATLLKRTLAEA